jgi:hypothetical protein
MKHKIIVESKNDRFFFERLLSNMEVRRNNGAQVGVEPICPEEDIAFDELKGLDSTKLKTKVKDVIADFRKEKLQKIGILLDRDDASESERLRLIDEAVQRACREMGAECAGPIARLNTFYEIAYRGQRFSLACGLVGLDGRGEMAHLLQATANRPADLADCLKTWRACAESKGHAVKDKDFVKLWVDFYIRWDTCDKNDRKQAYRKCSMHNFETVLEKDIFDFEHEALSELKTFFAPFLH